MNPIIERSVKESIQAKQNFFESHAGTVEACAKTMADRLSRGRKLLLFGNGGSAADCQHIAAEFVNRFQMERRPLPALALTCDTSVITSIGNDYSYDDIFLKQVQALGNKEDMALAISTSGNSPNVIKAAKEAKTMGLFIIGFSGAKGKLREISDMAFCVDSPVTARIQEVHILLAHILCDLTERMIFHDPA
ncbi:D-sedoheptulose-7-phosphate isomerase [Desulfospira joergensenii]|uniref:D-sedoheptulose-7-phosphate isomerase n=1 Tax=Desulfospira joergensenii TaxID=53329 RepID=UPI0003F50C20|nr:D-sedoheptulose 7-phosphate isomerase [Desulfospira joergensenii]